MDMREALKNATYTAVPRANVLLEFFVNTLRLFMMFFVYEVSGEQPLRSCFLLCITNVCDGQCITNVCDEQFCRITCVIQHSVSDPQMNRA